jgi:hypothetical protein
LVFGQCLNDGGKCEIEHTRIESRNAGMLESILSICQGKCADGEMRIFSGSVFSRH